MGPERIELSASERERLKVLQQVEEGHLKQVEAARRLRLTDRQVRRLQSRDMPLIDCVIRNSVQSNLAVRPGLHAGPFDRVVIIQRLAR